MPKLSTAEHCFNVAIFCAGAATLAGAMAAIDGLNNTTPFGAAFWGFSCAFCICAARYMWRKGEQFMDVRR